MTIHAFSFKRILLMPLGSYEYHGTELPPDTDSIVARSVAVALAGRLRTSTNAEVVILPSLDYGVSTEHLGLPNTASVHPDTYLRFLSGLLGSVANDDELIVLLNGHGGNNGILTVLESDFNYQHVRTKLFVPSLFPATIKDVAVRLWGEFDAHAGSAEASLVACYLDRPRREYAITPPRKARGMLRFFRTSELTTEGVIQGGATVTVDPDRGKELHAAIIDELERATVSVLKDLTDVLRARRTE